jgi:hypothetical protein
MPAGNFGSFGINPNYVNQVIEVRRRYDRIGRVRHLGYLEFGFWYSAGG